MVKIKGQTNYEINQAGYKQLPTPTEQEVDKYLVGVGAGLSYQNQIKYVGILCRERNDYTVIRLNNFNYDKAIQILKEILEGRGEILDIAFSHGNNYYEAGIRERVPEGIDEYIAQQGDPAVNMYVIFNANDGVIEVD